MEIIRDPIEKSPEYVHAMIKVFPILDEEFNKKKISNISFWKRKKELLAQMGVDWQSPAELNPELIKDWGGLEIKIKKDRRKRFHIEFEEIIPEIALSVMLLVLSMLLAVFLFFIYGIIHLVANTVAAFVVAGILTIISVVFFVILIKNSVFFLDGTCISGIILLLTVIFAFLYLVTFTY